MSARDRLFDDIWDMRSAAEKNALIDAHRDEVALELGRDALRDGLVPTLTQLVGETNATKLLTDYRDAIAHELAERQRKAIEGFDLDDHWGVLYRASDVEELPGLIDPVEGSG